MNNKWFSALAMLLPMLLLVLATVMILSQKTDAPDIAFTTIDGTPLRLKQLRGKVVLVNFWATTCTSCVGEMPKMVEAYQALAPQGYAMVAVAMEYDRPDWVLNYAKQHALPFSVALDLKGEAEQAFGGVRLTPTSFLIDKQGHIVQRYLGEPDFAKLKLKISELLTQNV